MYNSFQASFKHFHSFKELIQITFLLLVFVAIPNLYFCLMVFDCFSFTFSSKEGLFSPPNEQFNPFL